MKLINNIFIQLMFIIILIFILPTHVFAGQGCCSWHRGQNYCRNGHWVCMDGWTSSCECYSYELYDNSNNNYDYTNDNYNNGYDYDDNNSNQIGNNLSLLVIGGMGGIILYKIIKR